MTSPKEEAPRPERTHPDGGACTPDCPGYWDTPAAQPEAGEATCLHAKRCAHWCAAPDPFKPERVCNLLGGHEGDHIWQWAAIQPEAGDDQDVLWKRTAEEHEKTISSLRAELAQAHERLRGLRDMAEEWRKATAEVEALKQRVEEAERTRDAQVEAAPLIHSNGGPPHMLTWLGAKWVPKARADEAEKEAQFRDLQAQRAIQRADAAEARCKRMEAALRTTAIAAALAPSEAGKGDVT